MKIEYLLLIQKFLKGTISESEKEQLKIWVNTKEENSVFFTNEIKIFSKKPIADFDAEVAFERLYGVIQDKRNKKHILKTVLKYAAVVTVLLTIGFFAKAQLAQTFEANTAVVSQENERKEENNITLTLSDGSTKSINQNGEEVLKDSEGKIIANKGSDTLIFKTDPSSNTAELVFNEIFIPKGQTFKIKLADGTLVWLNAGSKLRFPQSFSSASATRTVYLTGEAFFEVTKNEKQPFIVNANDVNVKVLGTQFNVSSYETDHAIATTLVEGSVSIFETSAPEKNKLQLTPSFQANFDKSNGTLSKQKVDTDIYTSWMQNKLYINGLNFLQILKKLERMHNVSFINNAPGLDKEVYQGEFENETIESILKTIALSTPFTYKIEQNIITINQ